MTAALTQSELKRLLVYEPDTGLFFWTDGTAAARLFGQFARSG